MMKRRILAAAVSAALLLTLAACGGGNGASSNPGGGSSSQAGGSGSDGSRSEAGSNEAIGSASSNVVLAPAGGSTSSAGDGQPAGSGADASGPDTGSSSSAGNENSGGGNSTAGSKIKLTLNRTNVELNKAGATFKLRYTVDPDIYDGVAAYTSSDTNVATVDESGTVRAVAPGKATITVKYDSASATASVNCNWTETPAGTPGASDTSQPTGEGASQPAAPSAPVHVDLSAFYSNVTGKYEFAMLTLADNDILDMFYEGMSGIDTEQRLIYICEMSINNGEFGLVQVKDSKDVDAVKNIFQARVDTQASGGAWYPQAMESWTNNARIVSNGNYVMMVVHENCDDIVKEFNALF